MTSSELRKLFLRFFNKKGHKIIPSASLIPENDPTVLFTTAGMHPLVPFLLGEKHPSGKRLTSAQKCIRTVDIDEVGDDTHNTFFEMLGNWSLGDYWKEDAIKWSYEFLTKELKISTEKLAVSCFAGDDDAPKDKESAEIWEGLGIKKERIAFLPKEDNWWGPAGQTGPCGPDTEMFYWKLNDTSAPEEFDPKDKNWVEIWNDVFMQYIKTEDGKYIPAKQKNVDTGMGLERTIAVLNGKENVYETDLFLSIIKKIEELSGKKYEENKKAFRIIADHVKTSAFLLASEIEPSNLGRGYILRRLIRRAIRYGKQLGIKENFIVKIYPAVAEIYADFYNEIKNKKDFILKQFETEEEKFEKILEIGLREFEKLDKISGKDAFLLYQSFGFPIEITEELAKEKGISINIEEFKEEFKKHQELSQTASAGMFKGGLADASLETTKLHTAAHLMLAGLRKVLGENVVQKGSNITAERLRFDFLHSEKMTGEQIRDVENFVNGIIKKDLTVSFEEMTLGKAKELGAMGVFESKYGENVKVYTVGSGDNIASREICGGPHVERTGVLGHFKIQKEESSSSGVRRIKAVLE
ncbi:MAG: alanine--tRNA ligase [Candidatus Staskawiczbacteria bacterium RIFOXYC1_FULL_37_43]|nr:MAG: alanine--tRNA ligase [Candidatus Staskawiczbacteria bacterium RIFCSPLOWO2_01_FULL_37_19]OGZ76117.1 MAG: alanine--tRNA ligase [Candidatus Staskawiczbacteria bacterium RIFOXYA1_FULL_37_15]OGZ76475.1 MAG: alanine--tRNA ligase [Candidatus Staskawiczbacteria bacterium RIFOXYA12_FULL_37_10]OGZ80084.1 MAG: alanine--tRNA ligase [Candidatus Staskawiczbacteria bacterium RIFOXYB1_FULL_38_37]OGZ81723.1 MAG: alanine--tRNA ligase [Candidatus Staskawiczbacteria bacterium RIFOXYC1_FULL_37_43]OGZ83305.